MIGKMVLPFLGGAASVWTTCVLFFQAMLLGGYMYAHLLGRIDSVRRQIIIHVALLFAPLAFLPFHFHATPNSSASGNPAGWLMLQLLLTVGFPFFMISSTAPLLQNWLARTRDVDRTDPYFLYAASNAGSMLALVLYPFVVEPRFGVETQNRLWLAGYITLIVLLAGTCVLVWKRTLGRSAVQLQRTSSVYVKGWLRWVTAAFVPSALMLAVTNHIAANLTSAPFLWIVPLAIYLLTFIQAFGTRSDSSSRISRTIPVVLLAGFPMVAAGVIVPPGLNWIVIVLHLILLYSGALLCHRALAASRPDPAHLTQFYFWVAVGGVVGGIFTALIAPAIFSTVLEYPLLIATLPFFRTSAGRNATQGSPLSGLLPAALFVSGVLILWILFRFTVLGGNTEALALAHTAFIFVCYKFRNNARQFALAFTALMIAYTVTLPEYIEGRSRLYVSRNFFGVKKITESGGFRRLLHGDTTHGIESTDPQRAGVPLSYYHSTGPVGDIHRMMDDRHTRQRVGVIGLGSGSLATLGNAMRTVTFYEVDPEVEPIARTYFSFLGQCGTNCDVIVGDGRLQLSASPDRAYDLLMLDAFSSDSIPSHLLSREALSLYLAKLAPDGVLDFHVSNRYLNLRDLVSALVVDSGLVAFARFDKAGDLRGEGKFDSDHIVAARSIEQLGSIPRTEGWTRISPSPDFQIWTDDYSNLLSLIRWH
jgi:hypothetical protein